MSDIYKKDEWFQEKEKNWQKEMGVSLNEFLEDTSSYQDIKKLYLNDVPATDLSNSDFFLRLYAPDIRYCFLMKEWYIWDKTRWLEDIDCQIMERAKRTIKSFYTEANVQESHDEKKNVIQQAIKSESRSKLENMVELSKSAVPIRPKHMDTNDFLLNLENGILDLRRGELLDHSREHYITKKSPVIYDPEAKCPMWLKFIDEIMNGNKELITFLQRAIGQSLSGDTKDRFFYICFGTGANGKSTFLNTIIALLGLMEYAVSTPVSTIMEKREEYIPNDVARLRGARFVTAFEGNEEKRLDEGAIKRMTGNDPMTARFLNKEFFDFYPKFKIWFCTNHRPIIRGTDKAIWDRIKLIPFSKVIPEEEQDKDLGDKLKTELPGILNWSLTGCLNWQIDGISQSKAVIDATDKYRYAMDDLGSFLDDYCIVDDEERTASIKDNISEYDMRTFKHCTSATLYKKYLDVTGNHDTTQKNFTEKMLDRGFYKKHFKRATNWIGVGLLDISEST